MMLLITGDAAIEAAVREDPRSSHQSTTEREREGEMRNFVGRTLLEIACVITQNSEAQTLVP